MSSQLHGLCSRHGLNEGQARQLEVILDQLASDPQAPSSVTDRVRAAEVHLADSLAALELEPVKGASAAVDIGAGAGFPGLALAVALPACSVSLLESQGRKCSYLERCLDAARVTNASVVNSRAEEWTEGMGRHDLATARAVAAQSVVLEYAAPLLGLGGVLVDWRGRRDGEEEAAAAMAASELGLELVTIESVRPYPDARDHHLHVYSKVRETPERFPRRAGLARKRPLGLHRAS